MDDLDPQYRDLFSDEDAQLVRDFLKWSEGEQLRWPNSEHDLTIFCELGVYLARTIEQSRKFQQYKPPFAPKKTGAIDEDAASLWEEKWLIWLGMAETFVLSYVPARRVSLFRRAVCRRALELMSDRFQAQQRVRVYNALTKLRYNKDAVSPLIEERMNSLIERSKSLDQRG